MTFSAAVTNNIHGRNEGWFNWPTGSTDPALPYITRVAMDPGNLEFVAGFGANMWPIFD